MYNEVKIYPCKNLEVKEGSGLIFGSLIFEGVIFRGKYAMVIKFLI